jgi:hypothetical protein
MDRMGHASTKAALIYLHRSGARDRAIADALSAMVEEAQKTNKDEDSQPEDLTVVDEQDEPPQEGSGTQRARRRKRGPEK